jgi:hypothetical protein
MEWCLTTLTYTNLEFLSEGLDKTPPPLFNSTGGSSCATIECHGNAIPLLPVVVGQIMIQMDCGG